MLHPDDHYKIYGKWRQSDIRQSIENAEYPVCSRAARAIRIRRFFAHIVSTSARALKKVSAASQSPDSEGTGVSHSVAMSDQHVQPH